MEAQGKPKLTPQERRRLDRQRFIGLQTQQKLLNSLVLITPVNGPNTELAKNLVLAGVNIVLYDDADVTEYDVETNFLISNDDIGSKRALVIYNRIKDMNPAGKNQYVLKDIMLQFQKLDPIFFDRYMAVCTSFTQFAVINQWDKITKLSNKPYYNMVCCGFHSFAYISLGKQYTYQDPPSKKNPKKYNISSLNMEQCLQISKEQLKKTSKKQYGILQAILMMSESQKIGLSFDVYRPNLSEEDMLYCMVQLGQDLKQNNIRNLLIQFARLYGIDYCPVYSVIGSIISQQIIKVAQNQHQPAMNWLVFNSEEGYCSVLKLKEQDKRISSKIIEV